MCSPHINHPLPFLGSRDRNVWLKLQWSNISGRQQVPPISSFAIDISLREGKSSKQLRISLEVHLFACELLCRLFELIDSSTPEPFYAYRRFAHNLSHRWCPCRDHWVLPDHLISIHRAARNDAISSYSRLWIWFLSISRCQIAREVNIMV